MIERVDAAALDANQPSHRALTYRPRAACGQSESQQPAGSVDATSSEPFLSVNASSGHASVVAALGCDRQFRRLSGRCKRSTPSPAPDSPEIASLCSLTRCPNASCTCSGAWPFVASRVNDPRVAVYGGLSFGLVGSPGTVPAGADGPEDCRHLQSATSPRAASLGSRAGERITRRGRVALGEGRGALSGHRRMVCVLLGSRAALPAKRRTTRKRPRFRRGRSAMTVPVLGSGSSVRNRRPAI